MAFHFCETALGLLVLFAPIDVGPAGLAGTVDDDLGARVVEGTAQGVGVGDVHLGDERAGVEKSIATPVKAKRGKKLAKGQTVITGSLIGINWLTGRHQLQGVIDGCGEVAISLEA